jgi:hypothetical protein
MSEEKKTPQHLKMFADGFRWDWRRENPVEIVILVFGICIFFLLPRAGCGVTSADVKDVDLMKRPTAESDVKGGEAADPKKDAKNQPPQG